MSRSRDTADQINRLNSSAANATAITIDSSENVLVGKTTTSGSVTGLGLYNSGLLEAVADGDIAATLKRLNSDGDILRFRKDNTTVGSIGAFSSSNFGITGSAANKGGLIFATSEVLPAKNGTYSSSTVDLGNSGTLFKDLYLSGGVYLGGTGAANKLSDYESGTWTATVGLGTVTSNTGTYIKVGSLVKVKVELVSFSDLTTASALVISGLPFASSGAQACGVALGRYMDVSPDGAWINGSSINLYRTTTGNWTSVLHSELINSSTAIYLEGTYTTTA